MSVKKDFVQLDIEINGKKAGQTYSELQKNARDLTREINKLKPGTEEFIKKSQDLQKVRGRLNEITDAMRGIDRSILGTIKSSFSFQNVLKGIATVLPSLAIASVFQRLSRFASETLDLFDKQAKAVAQVRTGLESTGNAAGRTLEQLTRRAQELQEKTIFGDEEILQGVTAQLLTFTNIAGEQFDRTQKAALDLATRLDGDLKSASIQLGKALNDPVANLSALSRSGIQFSKDQKETINALIETNQLAEAQTIILDELEKQYGGSAEAAAKAGTGGYKQFQNVVSDIKEVMGEIVAVGLNTFLPFLQNGARLLQNITNRIVGFYRDQRTEAQKQIDTLKAQQNEANTLFTALVNLTKQIDELEDGTQDYNSASQAKNEILKEINTKYGEYLPNLLTEKSTINEITEAQRLLNDEMVKKQLILAFQEEINDAIQREIQARKGLANIQRARASGESRRGADDLLGRGGTPAQAQIAEEQFNNLLSQADQYNKALVNDAQSAQEDINKTYEILFKDIGVSFQDILNQLNAGPIVNKINDINTKAEKEVKESIESIMNARLRALELTASRERLILDAQQVAGEVSQKEYTQRSLEITEQLFTDKFALIEELGLQENELYDRLDLDRLKFQTEQEKERQLQALAAREKEIQDAIGTQETIQQAEERRLKESFANQLLSEQEYQLQLQQLKLTGYESLLQVLRDLGEEETAIYQEIADRRLDIIVEMNRKIVDNEVKTQDFTMAIAQGRVMAAQQAFEGALEFLKADENARKKNAGVIKAFEIGRIKANLFSEIAGYYASSAQYGPAGPVIAKILSGIAIFRSIAAVRNVARQEFYGGGKVPVYSSDDGVISGPANIVPTKHGDNILAYVKQGETILNDDQVIKLGGSRRMREVGVPGYTTGGVVQPTSVSTEPRVSDLEFQTGPSVDQRDIMARLDTLIQVVRNWPKTLKANVVYTDIEAMQNDLNELNESTSL